MKLTSGLHINFRVCSILWLVLASSPAIGHSSMLPPRATSMPLPPSDMGHLAPSRLDIGNGIMIIDFQHRTITVGKGVGADDAARRVISTLTPYLPLSCDVGFGSVSGPLPSPSSRYLGVQRDEQFQGTREDLH